MSETLPEWVWRWTVRAEGAEETDRPRYAQVWHRHRCGELSGWAGLLLYDALLEHRTAAAVGLMRRALGVPGAGAVDDALVAASRAVEPDPAMDACFSARAELCHDAAMADSRLARGLRERFARLFRLQGFLLE